MSFFLIIKPFMKIQNQMLLAILGISLIFSACKKVQESTSSTPSEKQIESANDLVPVPSAGMIPRSHIHFIEKGYKVRREGNHFMKVDAENGSIVEDYGIIQPTPFKIVQASSTSGHFAGQESTSWVTWAEWQNASSSSISSFSTNWTVPNNPTTTTDGQSIYIYNALENGSPTTATEIIQPVLQWGVTPAGSSPTGWGIANWYVVGSTAFISPDLIPVSPGTNLQGVITNNGQLADGSYSYTSSFTGYSNSMQISDAEGVLAVPQQTWAYETLEAWGPGGFGVVQASDYPAGQSFVNMNNIFVYLNGGLTIPSWAAETGNENFGESTEIQSDGALYNPLQKIGPFGGNMYIYWHPVPKINNSASVGLTTTSTTYTITGYQGSVVNFSMNADAIEPGPRMVGTTTATLISTTSGVVFSNGGSSISATNGSVNFTVTMPASGSFTAVGSYTTNTSLPAHASGAISVD